MGGGEVSWKPSFVGDLLMLTVIDSDDPHPCQLRLNGGGLIRAAGAPHNRPPVQLCVLLTAGS